MVGPSGRLGFYNGLFPARWAGLFEWLDLWSGRQFQEFALPMVVPSCLNGWNIGSKANSDHDASSGCGGCGAWHPSRSTTADRSSRNPHSPSMFTIGDRYRQQPSMITIDDRCRQQSSMIHSHAHTSRADVQSHFLRPEEANHSNSPAQRAGKGPIDDKKGLKGRPFGVIADTTFSMSAVPPLAK